MADSPLALLTAATAGTGGLFYGTQSGADRKFTLTAAGATLAEAADAAAQRTALACASLAANTFTGAQTIPTTSASTIAAARVGGITFGSDPATADQGISAFNNSLFFFNQGNLAAMLVSTLEFAFSSDVTVGWSSNPASASPGRDLYIGRAAADWLRIGKSSATPSAQTFSGPAGVGTNIVGGKLSIAPGQSTGNATPAVLALQGTAAGSSGTTAQTLVDVLSIIREGVIRITNIPTSSAGLSTGDVYSNAGILTIV